MENFLRDSLNRGLAIPEDERSRIFEKYYTGKKVGALAGTGLGLYIGQKLMELHGSSLSVDGESERSCFLFSLPLAAEGEDDE